MKPSRLFRALAAATLLPLGGCCTMARLFCGPDKSPWVPIAHDTAARTLATFLEAIRRDDLDRIYQCLARSFKERHGLDFVTFSAGWARLQQEVTGLHLLGYAEVPQAPLQQRDGGVSYEIEVEGRKLRIDLVRQSFTEVSYRDRDDRPQRSGGVLDFDTLNHLATVEPAGFDQDGVPQSRVDAAAIVFAHPGMRELPLARIDAITVGREWKVADVAMPTPR